MTHHQIGEITLNVSSFIYFIWFLPQLWMNFKRKNTDGLSLWMHGLLLLGYSTDLLYGFGRDMQWQYRMVTIVGLVCLFIQHYQFGRYGLHSKAIKINYVVLSGITILVLLFAIYNFTIDHHSKRYYDIAGYIEDACFWTYMLPQIIKNFRSKSTEGLSIWFVVISITLSFFDMTSALMLHWDLPSLLNPSIEIIKKFMLIFQMAYYARNKKNTASFFSR